MASGRLEVLMQGLARVPAGEEPTWGTVCAAGGLPVELAKVGRGGSPFGKAARSARARLSLFHDHESMPLAPGPHQPRQAHTSGWVGVGWKRMVPFAVAATETTVTRAP